MAKRYSGDLQISVVYDDKNHYRTAVSRGGKLLWRGIVNPAPSGFGPGVAYDSSQAYDEVASSALAFADHDVGGISDDAEYNEEMTGYLIRRTPRAKSARNHATKKGAKIQVGDCVVMRDPHRKFLTSTTGGTVFKVLAIDGVTLTLEGPMDHHPKHRRQKIMGAHQFKKVACPRPDWPDAGAPTNHATKKRQIVVRKVGSRWQPLDGNGRVVRGSIYNADGTGYSSKEGALEAAAMLRKLGPQG